MAFLSVALYPLLSLLVQPWLCAFAVRPELTAELSKATQALRPPSVPGKRIGKELETQSSNGKLPPLHTVTQASHGASPLTIPLVTSASKPQGSAVHQAPLASANSSDVALHGEEATIIMDAFAKVGEMGNGTEEGQKRMSVLETDRTSIGANAAEAISNASHTVQNVVQWAEDHVKVFSPWASLLEIQKASQKANGTEIEHDFSQGNESTAMSKVIIVMVEMAIPCLGCIGMDRCMAGQLFYGVMKGMTCGGFFVWFAIDYAYVVFSTLRSEEEMTELGFNVKFEPESVASAWKVCIFWLLVTVSAYIPFAVVRLNRCAQNRKRRKEEEAIRSVFVEFDADHDGYLSLEDMLHIRRKLGLSVSRFDGLQMLKEMGKHDNEKVSADEFVDIVKEGQCDLPHEFWEKMKSAIKQHAG